MTREEAIDLLDNLIGIVEDNHNSDYDTALHIAIKALEQEPILDKIRAEIESQRSEVSKKHSENDKLQFFYNGLNDGLKDARDIIDEYKAESEVDNGNDD